MNRRSFMGSILALGAAPAIVRADALMRIVPNRHSGLYIREDWSWPAPPLVGERGLEEMRVTRGVARYSLPGQFSLGQVITISGMIPGPNGRYVVVEVDERANYNAIEFTAIKKPAP